MYLKDKANNFTTREYVLNKMLPEMKYLASQYEPDVWWSDGDWEAKPEYWGSKDFLAWLYNESPTKNTVVTNDRWGQGTSQTHGGYYSGPDRFNPGHILKHKFEDAFTVDRQSWGYRRNMNIEDIQSVEELVANLVEIVSCNGNVLINVGPTKEGTISPIFQERLTQMGQWLTVNGQAIYSTVPFVYQNDSLSTYPQVWYTLNPDYVYATALGWPKNNILTLGDVKLYQNISTVEMLGYGLERGEKLDFETTEEAVSITFPSLSKFIEECGKHCLPAFVLRIHRASPKIPKVQFDRVIT